MPNREQKPKKHLNQYQNQPGERSAATNVAKQERAKVSARKLSAAARDFDRTFADARSQGLKVFTWRGKQYNTKLK